ncbi:MAG: serine/threonine-protein kinase [Verrucomicrobiales bacterium]|nr:serine/threonine-protein kinase [Verrucomicrobiales bacterium]
MLWRDFSKGLWLDFPIELRSNNENRGNGAAVAFGAALSPPRIQDHELLRCVGRGSYGEVWLARNLTGGWLAIKVIHQQAGEQAKAFEREFRGLQNYEPISHGHESLMSILHAGRNDAEGFFYYVMELADDARQCSASSCHTEHLRDETEDEQVQDKAVGTSQPRQDQFESQGSTGASLYRNGVFDPSAYEPRTLKLELQRRDRLSFMECVELGLALTTALDTLHARGLVHRDVKPANIIYVNGRPKLADIGLVAVSDATVSFVGTAGYVAPEGPRTPQADLYSLGKVLYEASTGKDRQEFPDPRTDFESGESAALWAELNEVMLKACKSLPHERYHSALAMRDDLLLLQMGHSLRRLRVTQQRLKYSLALGAAAVILGIAVSAVQRSWMIAAKERLVLVEAQGREQRRQMLMQENVVGRQEAPDAGWSAKAWSNLIEAAAIRTDDLLRDQAATCLAGMDAHLVHSLDDFSASSVAFDLTSENLAVGGMTAGVRLLSVKSGEWRIAGIDRPGRVAFHPDGMAGQFVAQDHGSFLLWGADGQRSIREFKLSGLAPPGSWQSWVAVPTAIAPDFSSVAGAACFTDGDGKFAAWDVASGHLLLEGVGKVYSLAFSPDGSLLAAGDDDGRITIWSVLSRSLVTVLHDDRLSIRSLAFARDRSSSPGAPHQGTNWVLAAGDEGGTIALWDVAARSVRAHLRGSSFHVYALGFSGDGTLLASAGRGEARLWDVAAEKLVLRIPGSDAHTGIAFSTDGKMLALCNQTGFRHGRASVYALESGRGVRALRGLGGLYGQVKFSPDGRLIAALAHNWRVGIWETLTGQLQHVLTVPKGDITAAAWLGFNSDGSQFAFGHKSAGSLWNVSSGIEACSWRREDMSGCWSVWDGRTPRAFQTLASSEGDSVYGFDSDSNLVHVVLEGERKAASVGNGGNIRAHWTIRRVGEIECKSVTGNFEWPFVANLSAQLADNARYLIVDGVRKDNEGIRRTVVAFDLNTGEERWNVSQGTEDVGLSVFAAQLDSTLTTVDYGIQHSPLQRAHVATGLLSGVFEPAPQVEGPMRRYATATSPDRVFQLIPDHFALFQAGISAPLVRFATGPRDDAVADVSADASLLAWGTSASTVAVCDLEEVRRRLNTLGVGW